MKLFRSELRLRWRSLIAWSSSVALLVFLVVSIYPTVRDNPDLDSIYGDLSPAAQALLGGSDLTSPVGYLNTQLFAFFLPAVLLVFGITRGAASIAGEEEDRTLDLLLAQPLRRSSAYLQKAAYIGLGIVLLTAATWLPIVTLNGAVGLNLSFGSVVAVCLQMGLFVLAASLAAQGIAAVGGRRSWGLAIASGYVIVSYLVYGLSGSVSWLQPVRPLTLWRWYFGNDPLSSGLGAAEVLVLMLVSAIALSLGVLGFQKRDLRS